MNIFIVTAEIDGDRNVSVHRTEDGATAHIRGILADLATRGQVDQPAPDADLWEAWEDVRADSLDSLWLDVEPMPQTPLELAAPDMLAALELAAERLEISNCEGEEDSALATIRAAIAKAKGGKA
jgi:hypothetical protein